MRSACSPDTTTLDHAVERGGHRRFIATRMIVVKAEK